VGPKLAWPGLFNNTVMEKTLTIYVESLNEQWELPDNLALKWNEYEKELSPEEQKQVNRITPDE